MDNNILEPDLVWVEGHCYRFCESAAWSSVQATGPYQEELECPYQQEYEDISYRHTSNEDEIQIDKTNEGRYKHVFFAPKALYAFIMGYKGSSKKKLETETQTFIKVPKISDNNQNISITGSTRAGVIWCRQRIDLLMESSKKRIPFTHFVSIPLNTDEIMTHFEALKAKVLSDLEQKSRGITEDVFVNARRLHLTIGMLRLLSEKEKNQAVEVLTACVKEVIEPILKRSDPVVFKVQGLGYMNDDPSKVSVLYGEVLENRVLQEIANKTFAFFAEKGHMSVQYTEEVKLHMTVMKTSHLAKKGERFDSRPKKLDATKMLKTYKDYFFGELKLTTINISERETEAKDGHYITLKKINLLE